METVVHCPECSDSIVRRLFRVIDQVERKTLGFSRGYGYAYFSFDLYEKRGFSLSITKTDFSGFFVELRENTGNGIDTKTFEFSGNCRRFWLDIAFLTGEKVELFFNNRINGISILSSRKLTKFSN